MPSMDVCPQICAFGLSLLSLFPVTFGCIDGKHFTSSSKFVLQPSLVKLPNLKGNSIKNLKVELTIQIYIIEPS